MDSGSIIEKGLIWYVTEQHTRDTWS